MKTSSILLATILKNPVSEKSCVSNYKHISRTNHLMYNHNITYHISDLMNSAHPSILCMNHFSAFLVSNISKLLGLLNEKIHLVVPKDNINMPIEMIPFYIKNSEWSRKFLELYSRYNKHNLHMFLTELGYYSASEIVYTDFIQMPGKQALPHHIVRQYGDLSTQIMLDTINKYNRELGII